MLVQYDKGVSRILDEPLHKLVTYLGYKSEGSRNTTLQLDLKIAHVDWGSSHLL